MSAGYKKQYEHFSQEVSFVARTWHHHLQIEQRAMVDNKFHAALNKAAQFWLDHRFMALQTTIIVLGRVFDKDSRAHSLSKTLVAAKNELEHFEKSELRKRKIGIGETPNWLDAYLASAHELSADDLKNIRVEYNKANSFWKKLEPLRNKIFAHGEILSDAERSSIYASAKTEDITSILQILLNISEALWQAEVNGKKPDFASDQTRTIAWAKKDIQELGDSLTC